jgi:lipid II:glycine glycyltransferase (peptidoglycan interpeptide bridge formation enzyme)
LIRIDKRVGLARLADIYLSDGPVEVKGCSAATFYWCPNLLDVEGFEREEAPTAVIDLTKDIDIIWDNIDRTGRKKINQAEKEGIKVSVSDRFDDFWELNLSFIRRKGYGFRMGVGLPPLEQLRSKGTLLIAEHDGQILSGHVHLEDEVRMIGLVSASRRLEGDPEMAKLVGKANRLIYWHKIKRGKEKGLRELDFAGIVPDKDLAANPSLASLNEFKLSLGAVKVMRYNYRRRYSRVYDTAYRTMRWWRGRKP